MKKFNSREVKKELAKKKIKGLEIVVLAIQAFADPYVPVDKNNFRDSAKTVKMNNKEVKITYDVPYANYQYFGGLRHVWRGNQPKKIRTTGRVSGTSRRSYNKAYRKLDKSGRLTAKPNKSKWLHVVLNKKSTLKELDTIFKNVMAG